MLVSAFTDDVLKARRAANLPLGQIERVAERLGVIAAAGELAGEFGIVPWTPGEATAAAKGALELWIAARGGEKPFEEDQAIKIVRKAIEAHGDSRFDELDRVYSETDLDTYGKGPYPVRDRLGYRKGKGETQRWLIFPQAWRDEVCAGLDAEFVAGILKTRRMLETEPDRITKQVKVFGKNKRFYVVTPDIFEGEDCSNSPGFLLARLLDDVGFRDITGSGARVRTLGRTVLFDGENAARLQHREKGVQIALGRVALARPVVEGARDKNEVDRSGRNGVWMLWAEVVRFDLAEDGLVRDALPKGGVRGIGTFRRGAGLRAIRQGRNVCASCCAGVGRENLGPPSPDARIDFNNRHTGLQAPERQ